MKPNRSNLLKFRASCRQMRLLFSKNTQNQSQMSNLLDFSSIVFNLKDNFIIIKRLLTILEIQTQSKFTHISSKTNKNLLKRMPIQDDGKKSILEMIIWRSEKDQREFKVFRRILSTLWAMWIFLNRSKMRRQSSIKFMRVQEIYDILRSYQLVVGWDEIKKL